MRIALFQLTALTLLVSACGERKSPADKPADPARHGAKQPATTEAPPKEPQPKAAKDWSSAPDCQVSLCLAGAVRRSDGANPVLERICGSLTDLVEECSGATCQPLFSMFQKKQAVDALVAKLDANKDGRYDSQDPPCRVALVGYSWGGVNAAEIARELLADDRWGKARKTIHRMVLLDPFAPHARPSLKISSNVAEVWEYRRSIAPPSDCSSRAPMGPYIGLPPVCSSNTACRDYDLSLPETSSGGKLKNVGHCTIVGATRDAILHNVRTGSDAKL